MPEPRLDKAPLFRSEVTDSSTLTRFDYPRVSSSPDDLFIQFSILGTINILVALATGLLIVSILRSRNLRRKPFDLYLLFIAIPDFISGFSCMLTCFLSVKGKEYVGEAMCGYQSFYLNASVAANTWMNAVIIYEIHKLLRFSHIRRRYTPPTVKRVICQAAGVYLYACVWGTICAVQAFFPSHAYGGFYCIPMEEKGTTWFFYLVFLPGVFIIPSLYAVAVMAHIMYFSLLPPTGKRRALALFLMRIIFLYFVVFVPLAMSILVGNFVYFRSSWGYYVPAVMTHLQGILTTLLIYFTDDKIAASMRKVLRCEWVNVNSENTRWPSAVSSRLSLGLYGGQSGALNQTKQTETERGGGDVDRVDSEEWLSAAPRESDRDVAATDQVAGQAMQDEEVANHSDIATRQYPALVTSDHDEMPNGNHETDQRVPTNDSP